MLSRSVTIVSIVTLLGVSPHAARAQDPGSFRGTVIDAATQRPIMGASITVQPGMRHAVTDSLGVFHVSGVSEGLYDVLVRRIGFTAAQQINVRVNPGKASIVRFELDRLPLVLNESHVTVDPFPRDPEQSVSRSTYTADEIRRTPGAVDDIFRAVETLPGVSSSSGGFSAFSVRGGGPHDNLIFIDEIPFDKVTHLEGGSEGDEAKGGRLSIFAPELIQSADFRAGGFPAQYGGKNASLLSLKLKDGNPETATYGVRYDLLGWELDYDGPSRVARNTSVLFSARHQDLANILKVIGRADAGSPSFSDVIFKSTTDFGVRDKLTVLGVVSPERVFRTVDQVLTEKDTTDTQLYSWRETKGVAGVTWQRLVGQASVINSSVYLHRFTRANTQGQTYPDVPSADGRTVASRPGILTTDESETDVGLRSVGRFNVGPHTLVLSGEVTGRKASGGRAVDGADTLYTFDQYDPRPVGQEYLVVTPSQYDARVSARVTDVAGSASYARGIAGDGTVTLGARYEHDGMSGHDDLLPRGSIAFPSVGGVSVNIAAGSYLQPLDIKDITANATNRALPPIRSNHYILGFNTLLRPDVQLRVEGYYRTLSDLPVLRDRSSGMEIASGTGHASGVDVSLIRRLTDRVFGQASYSYSVSKRNNNRGGLTYDGDGNQPHAATLLAGYTLNARWSFSGKYKYATGQPTSAYVVHPDVFPGSGLLRYSQEITGYNGRRLPDLHTLNVRVDYQAHAGKVGIDAYLDVLDVTDRLNINTLRFVERTGGTFKDGIPIVPTFGLKFLF